MKKKAPHELSVIKINEDRENFSICLTSSAEKIDLVEAAAARDPGHRGIQHMIQFRVFFYKTLFCRVLKEVYHDIYRFLWD